MLFCRCGYGTSIIPTSLHTSNSSFRFDLPKENGIESQQLSTVRHRCIPRKRRVLQQPCLYQQNQQPWPDNQIPRLLAPNICITPGPDLASPPVSPKTVIPISYQGYDGNPSTSASSLRPCHICHRRPTTREVLDAYADCDLCGQRACYICLRQCDAPDCSGSVDLRGNQVFKDRSDRVQESIDGHETEARQARKVCSCCAVEGATEMGVEVVRCLDCVRAHLPQWQASGQAC